MTLVQEPRASFTVDQRYLIEPLGGPQGVRTYLDGFPSEVYNKSIDSHLVKFLYSLLGPAGIGSVRRNYLEARLVFEAHGLELSNLDQFYGNPFQFGRIEEEVYSNDTLGLLPQEDWNRIRAKDAKYRNRCIDFLSGAKAGNTPLGMRLVARSGLGHEVEIIENYRFLYDSNSDDKLGLKSYGKTSLLNEMIILPRQEAHSSEVQKISFSGNLTGGSFRLILEEEYTDSLPYNATRQDIKSAIEKISTIERDDIEVTGGPVPDDILIRFVGRLSGRDVSLISFTNELLGNSPQIIPTTITQGFDAANETVEIPPRDRHHLQAAVDRIRPVSVIPTLAPASGTKSRLSWVRSSASSEFDEMLRYVTGSGTVRWPEPDGIYWIRGGIEVQAPRPYGELPYNYQAFHLVKNVDSYDESYLLEPLYETPDWDLVKSSYASNHIGPYNPSHSAIFSFLQNIDSEVVQTADRIVADYAEPLTIDRSVETSRGLISLVNGIYPSDYQTLPGAPQIRYRDGQFWSSREKTEGPEFIELDLGAVKAINYLIFEITRKPVTIKVEYDLLSQGGARRWQTATEPLQLTFSPEQNPWRETELHLANSKSEMIYSRYLRLTFIRSSNTKFLTDGTTKYPWSIDVQNLRVGRNVNNVSS